MGASKVCFQQQVCDLAEWDYFLSSGSLVFLVSLILREAGVLSASVPQMHEL